MVSTSILPLVNIFCLISTSLVNYWTKETILISITEKFHALL